MYHKLIILPTLVQFFVVYCFTEASTFGEFKGNVDETILSRVSLGENEDIFTIRSKDRFVGFLSQAYLKSSINSTGWNILEVRTNPDIDDQSQAYYGGLIEGCISKDLIYQHWYNTKMNYCDQVGKEICANIRDYIKKNEQWMEDIADKYGRISSYWWQVLLNYIQILGIVDGYNICSGGKIISYLDFVLMNMDGDLEDLEDKFKPKDSPPRKLSDEGRCSAIIKLLPNNEDLYVAHNTWTRYNYLIRMQKRYIFSYHELPESPEIVPGRIITFSGYPGVISSIDDFYTISSNIAIQETTIGNSNKAIWKYVTPIGTVPEYIRVMVANRLAKSGRDWGRTFAKLNSGTYNNQWMIIDYNKFKPYQEPQKGLLWILEQVPGYVRGQDKTDLLKKKTYWPSYNVPYYEDIFNMSGNNELVKKYGDWFSYNGAPRSKLMERDHHKITSLDSLMTFMRYNDYENDPLSRCDCSPPYSASNAIASRHDLNKEDGSYPIPYLGHRPGGAIDAKLTSSSLIKDLQFIAVSGPTKGTNLPVFKWSTSSFEDKLNHIGQPDEWDFKPIKTEWTLNLP